MNNLFTELENQNKQIPLAEILRPKTIEDFLGQSNVVAPNSPILNLLKTNRLFSLIFWGTPGCGKTTLARLIATKTNANFIEISAVTSGVKDIKDAVEKAKESLRAERKISGNVFKAGRRVLESLAEVWYNKSKFFLSREGSLPALLK